MHARHYMTNYNTQLPGSSSSTVFTLSRYILARFSSPFFTLTLNTFSVGGGAPDAAAIAATAFFAVDRELDTEGPIKASNTSMAFFVAAVGPSNAVRGEDGEDDIEVNGVICGT